MPQQMINSLLLLFLSSALVAFWTWFWRFRATTVKRLEDEKAAVIAKANKLADEHRELAEKVDALQAQLGLVNQVVTPINQAMQALLIRELTHYHTPELDALLAKLPPEGDLTPEEHLRIAVLLKERAEELNGTIPESEREAAIILPYIIKRVKAEAVALVESTPQLKIVAVPPEAGADPDVPQAAVDDQQMDG